MILARFDETKANSTIFLDSRQRVVSRGYVKHLIIRRSFGDVWTGTNIRVRIYGPKGERPRTGIRGLSKETTSQRCRAQVCKNRNEENVFTDVSEYMHEVHLRQGNWQTLHACARCMNNTNRTIPNQVHTPSRSRRTR